MSDEVLIRSRGPHPYVLFAVPFALTILAAGIAGIVTMHLVVGLACVAGATWVLLSSAYSAWGRLCIRQADDTITVIDRLGPLERTIATFFRSQIRAVAPISVSPAYMMWPGSAGRQLRVVLDDRELRVGGGLVLDAASLDEISALLSGAILPPPSH